ncbi:MAG: DUF4055 domain-containing protein [Moorea sp. SIO3C2]|nr:DUF4055 domain-containing protein [Moorena sp. SIO3C2]
MPSYHHRKLFDIVPLLEQVADCYTGISNWINGTKIDMSKAARYLPRNEGEPPSAYQARLLRSRWVGFFSQAINGFAGLLTDYEIASDSPKSFVDAIADIDCANTSLTTFLSNADKKGLCDGWCLVLVEYPVKENILSAADEIANSDRPYLCLISRRDVINWSIVGNVLEWIVIRRNVEKPVTEFMSETTEQYWVLRAGSCEVYEIGEGGGLGTVELVQSFELRSPSGKLMDKIPAIFYPVSTLNPFELLPPLHDLALSNITHYQEWSDYREVRYKCNVPVPVLKGLLDAPDRLVIGPNTVVTLPPDGDFFYREPSGKAIEATRQAIIDIEKQMLQRSLAFFGGNSHMTATEAELRSAQTVSELTQMARDKESAVKGIINCWTQWTSEEPNGGIKVNTNLIKSPISSDTARMFTDLVVGGIMPTDMYWDIMSSAGIIPKNVELPSAGD